VTKLIADIGRQKELSLPVSQALALFNKLIRKISKKLTDIRKEAIGADIPVAPPPRNTDTRVHDNDGGDGGNRGEASKPWKPIETSVEDELDEAGDEVTRALRENQRAMIESLDLSKYVRPSEPFSLSFPIPSAHRRHNPTLNERKDDHLVAAVNDSINNFCASGGLMTPEY
jgi:hypothetical protein